MTRATRATAFAVCTLMLAPAFGSAQQVVGKGVENDRFFVVIEGTWWLGAGEKYDPDSTVAVGPGTYVFHKGGDIHYDGAKKEPVVIQVWGMGPDTNTPAEKK